MALIDIKVPDIGDFKDVAVIELLVKPGDTVKAEQIADHRRERQGLDGDPVVARRRGEGAEGQARRHGQRRHGDPDAGRGGRRGARRRRRAGCRTCAARRARAGCRSAAPAPVAASYAGGADLECDMLVLGAGPGGYSAAFRAADLGLKTVLVERFADARRRLPERRLHPVARRCCTWPR